MKHQREITLLTLCLFLLFSCSSRKGELLVREVVAPDSLRMVFAGDLMMHLPQVNGAWMDGGDSLYNFHPPFQHVKNYILAADLALVNLELTFGGKPYQGYPMFSTPTELADAIEGMGFDVVFIGNNHVLDRGRKGLETTIDLLTGKGFHHTGAFKDRITRNRAYPLIVKSGRIKLAFLNYTYDTNGLWPEEPNIVNYIDTVQMRLDHLKARKANPDFIITYIHWGEEYQIRENETQRQLARFLADNGSSLVVGTHPHVVQPFRYVTTQGGDSVPVIYSLGNFISNQRKTHTDGGILFEVRLRKEDGRTSISSLAYEPVWVSRQTKGGRSRYRLIPVNDYLRNKAPYLLTAEEERTIQAFYTNTTQRLGELPFSREQSHE